MPIRQRALSTSLRLIRRVPKTPTDSTSSPAIVSRWRMAWTMSHGPHIPNSNMGIMKMSIRKGLSTRRHSGRFRSGQGRARRRMRGQRAYRGPPRIPHTSGSDRSHSLVNPSCAEELIAHVLQSDPVAGGEAAAGRFLHGFVSQRLQPILGIGSRQDRENFNRLFRYAGEQSYLVRTDDILAKLSLHQATGGSAPTRMAGSALFQPACRLAIMGADKPRFPSSLPWR